VSGHRFTCPKCGDNHDDLYRGDDGHFITWKDRDGQHDLPAEAVCYDCWACWCALRAIWEAVGANRYAAAAYLLMRGFKHKEVACAMGMDRKTLWRWRKKIAQDSNLMSQIGQVIVLERGEVQ